jgi:hypothetical protein
MDARWKAVRTWPGEASLPNEGGHENAEPKASDHPSNGHVAGAWMCSDAGCIKAAPDGGGEHDGPEAYDETTGARAHGR